ncbi:hypothetical protein RGQ29_021620 [Quercus rubra]|uniref:Uncharacterized protein n=1 Tax=Quercus rubra TaxID=3512 RepID=A0AAN7IRK8_QUERU|nr:hypothetical protein RGQ29_021620 [Quercus rubra]
MFLVLFVVFLVTPTHCLGHQCLPKQHVALFIFGDSLVDAGNNNNYINSTTEAQANYGPYGETFFKYPTGRFSNGRIIPDFIVIHYSLDFIAYKAASGGVFFRCGTPKDAVIDLKTQLQYFKKLEKLLREKLGVGETKTLLARAVYLINIGFDGYGVLLFTTNSSALQSYPQEEYEIYKKGGRKFVIPNLGPFGCLPFARALNRALGNTGACLQEVNPIVKLHNEELSKVLQELEGEFNGFKYSIVNSYTYLSEIIHNPSNYGFKESRIACCGTGPYRGMFSCGGNEYVFLDSIHPSEKASQQFVELMWNGTLNITGPYNLKEFFENK